MPKVFEGRQPIKTFLFWCCLLPFILWNVGPAHASPCLKLILYRLNVALVVYRATGEHFTATPNRKRATFDYIAQPHRLARSNWNAALTRCDTSRDWSPYITNCLDSGIQLTRNTLLP